MANDQQRLLEQLQDLVALRDSGALSVADFESRAADLLTGSSGDWVDPPPPPAEPVAAGRRAPSAWQATPDPDLAPGSLRSGGQSTSLGATPEVVSANRWAAAPDRATDESGSMLRAQPSVGSRPAMRSGWVVQPDEDSIETATKEVRAPSHKRGRRGRRERGSDAMALPVEHAVTDDVIKKVTIQQPEAVPDETVAEVEAPSRRRPAPSTWLVIPDPEPTTPAPGSKTTSVPRRPRRDRRATRRLRSAAPLVTEQAVAATEIDAPSVTEDHATIDLPISDALVHLPIERGDTSDAPPVLDLEMELSVEAAPLVAVGEPVERGDDQESPLVTLPPDLEAAVHSYESDEPAVPEYRLLPEDETIEIAPEPSLEEVALASGSSYWDTRNRIVPVRSLADFASPDTSNGSGPATHYWDLTQRVLPPLPGDDEEWPRMRPGGYWNRPGTEG